VLALLLLSPAQAWAEWQIRPFLGLTFGGGTTFVDLEHAAGKPNLVFGVSGGLLGDVIGIDADFGHAPGFFQTDSQHLVLHSSATTLTGNIVIALPRRLAQYTLRPYFVGGAGLMYVRIDDSFGALPVGKPLPAIDIGGGATGFLSDRIGVNWDVRYFRSVGSKVEDSGLSFGAEQLSFWRASVALAIRY
jgi:hypothetical protein